MADTCGTTSSAAPSAAAAASPVSMAAGSATTAAAADGSLLLDFFFFLLVAISVSLMAAGGGGGARFEAGTRRTREREVAGVEKRGSASGREPNQSTSGEPVQPSATRRHSIRATKSSPCSVAATLLQRAEETGSSSRPNERVASGRTENQWGRGHRAGRQSNGSVHTSYITASWFPLTNCVQQPPDGTSGAADARSRR